MSNREKIYAEVLEINASDLNGPIEETIKFLQKYPGHELEFEEKHDNGLGGSRESTISILLIRDETDEEQKLRLLQEEVSRNKSAELKK